MEASVPRTAYLFVRLILRISSRAIRAASKALCFQYTPHSHVGEVAILHGTGKPVKLKNVFSVMEVRGRAVG